jgi:hypothetical protein
MSSFFGNHVLVLFLFALGVGALPGCASVAGSAGVNWASAQPGAIPNYEDSKTQAMEAIRLRLKDPDSAQFRNWGPFFKTLYNYGFGAVGRFDPLWAICAEVNAKNSYGGYSGFSYWFVKFRNGRAITDELGVNKGDYDCINGPSDPARRYSGS